MHIEAAATVIAKIAVIVGLVSATVVDTRYRLIPNMATSFVAGGGLFMRLLTAPGTAWVSLTVAGIVLAGLLVFAALRLMGAGDAKLIAAATLAEPIEGVAPLLLAIGIAGGILAAVYLLGGWAYGQNSASHSRLNNPPTVLARFFRHDPIRRALAEPIPYAAAVLGGFVWCTMSGTV